MGILGLIRTLFRLRKLTAAFVVLEIIFKIVNKRQSKSK